MTVNGWLQIAVFLGLVLLVTKPVGVFMTRVFNRERTFMDPVLRPIERLLYRLTGVDENHEMRWTEYAGSMLLFSVVSMLVLYAMERLQLHLPLNPQQFPGVPQALAFNTAASFTTNTNWQNYSGEVRDELSHADGRARVSQLHVGRGRYRAGDCLHSRHCPPADADHRQLLGRHGPQLPVGAAAVLRHRRAGAGFAGRGAEPATLRHGEAGRAACRCRIWERTASRRLMPNGKPVMDTVTDADHRARAGRFAGVHQGTRHQRRRLLQCQQCASLRKSDSTFEPDRTGLHLRHRLRSDLHAGPHDRIAGTRLGGVGGDGDSVSSPGVTVAYWAEAGGNPLLHGVNQQRDRHAAGRQHGRQGSPLRNRQHRLVGDGYDRRKLRRHQRLA